MPLPMPLPVLLVADVSVPRFKAKSHFKSSTTAADADANARLQSNQRCPEGWRQLGYGYLGTSGNVDKSAPGDEPTTLMTTILSRFVTA